MAFSFLTKNQANELILSRTYSFARLSRYLQKLILFLYRFSSFHLPPFLIQLCYFLSLAFLGSLLLILLKPSNAAFSPRYVDMLFMSTSALTVSGLGTVEMENLSSSQIVVLMLLMFLGGEVFISLLALLFRRAKQGQTESSGAIGVELEAVNANESSIGRIESGIHFDSAAEDLRPVHVRLLGYVMSSYVAVFHVFGTSLLLAYFAGVPRARGILKTKGINVFLFCLSTTVSSFANGGLIATNENMAIFNRDPVVLLLVILQVLAGNTLFPLFLSWTIWGLKKLTKRKEFDDMLKSSGEAQLRPLLPRSRTSALSLSALGLLTALLVLFCAMDWDGKVFDGLTSVEKLVSALFIAANARHAGENSIDCSLISPAVLVLIIFMMYLPSSMTFAFAQEEDPRKETTKKKSSLLQDMMFSQLSWVVIFIIAVCITERRKMSRDPLNFSTLSMIFEMISGYGNVGLSTGYSCSRLLKIHPEAICEDKPYSLSGWWSDEGKLILALCMLYGRLKKFSAGCGRAWKLY
ncbi:cation transporter HKT2-like [Canna indica]|uniref:Cation transporter HKT2-like n=1 Tax=Canna indica TaxID=4628 RepID=A0AAQ3KKE7_9LILI|nr:cation transporter HKT2-like [Canna indica]